jgi:hypothetical protein
LALVVVGVDFAFAKWNLMNSNYTGFGMEHIPEEGSNQVRNEKASKNDVIRDFKNKAEKFSHIP